ncbi:hypothetical protein I3843_16G109200 [Carya illinoinensis]|nr:hypothetical protein I3843_16G109200 [Carya illinoinensis]KAG7942552.1 hypothetical protein I3843_16G109200 [Carya illinoinensis]
MFLTGRTEVACCYLFMQQATRRTPTRRQQPQKWPTQPPETAAQPLLCRGAPPRELAGHCLLFHHGLGQHAQTHGCSIRTGPAMASTPYAIRPDPAHECWATSASTRSSAPIAHSNDVEMKEIVLKMVKQGMTEQL